MLQLGIVEKIIIGVIIACIAVAGYAGWKHYQQSLGASSERAKQEKANAEFRVRATKGAVDFDTCDRAGGMYDFRAGTCKLP